MKRIIAVIYGMAGMRVCFCLSEINDALIQVLKILPGASMAILFFFLAVCLCQEGGQG